MNYRIILYITGWVFNLQAIFMVLPCITALIYQEDEIYDFLIPILICLAVGILLTRNRPANKVFYIKDGCVAVALSWIILSITGALPFIISGSIPHPIDAI